MQHRSRGLLLRCNNATLGMALKLELDNETKLALQAKVKAAAEKATAEERRKAEAVAVDSDESTPAPLDPKDEDTIDLILAQIDNAIQYHDDVEPRTTDDEVPDEDDGGDADF